MKYFYIKTSNPLKEIQKTKEGAPIIILQNDLQIQLNSHENSNSSKNETNVLNLMYKHRNSKIHKTILNNRTDRNNIISDFKLYHKTIIRK